MLRAFGELKRHQHGIFERNQARALGLTDDAIRHRVSTGELARVYPRVYRDTASAVTWVQSMTAAVLWAGGSGAASHRSAAALWALDGCLQGVIEVTVPSSRKSPPGLIVHRALLPNGDVTSVSGLRATSPTRTLLDLAAVVDEETLEIALDSALRRGLTSVDYLARRFGEKRSRGRPGTAVVGRLLAERSRTAGHLESPLETKFLRLIRRERLPLPEAGLVVGRYRLDFAYPAVRLGIELDGYAFHSGRGTWESDRRRNNDLVALGWTILHFTWDDVTRAPQSVISVLRSHLTPNLLS